MVYVYHTKTPIVYISFQISRSVQSSSSEVVLWHAGWIDNLTDSAPVIQGFGLDEGSTLQSLTLDTCDALCCGTRQDCSQSPCRSRCFLGARMHIECARTLASRALSPLAEMKGCSLTNHEGVAQVILVSNILVSMSNNGGLGELLSCLDAGKWPWAYNSDPRYAMTPTKRRIRMMRACRVNNLEMAFGTPGLTVDSDLLLSSSVDRTIV
ncbi:hypothetical protein KCV03_g243, partial [Aureobasidium melanogenum]